MMCIISEEEAKQCLDLYNFEIWCIDLLRSIQELRIGPNSQDADFMREVATEAGQNMLAKLPELLKELEQLRKQGSNAEHDGTSDANSTS